MSLKIEQLLRNIQFTERRPKIYSSGVYLVPMKIQVHGIEKFVWVADEFNDDIFDSDGNSISVKVIANAIEDLCV